MTRLLEKAFSEASKLAPEDQDILAAELLDALADEEKWTGTFDESQDALAELAEDALREHRAGRSELLNPDGF
jgi:hypothetical protein